MKIIFYDVEHGSCCHVITPNGKHILIDIGSKNEESIALHIKNKYFFNKTEGIDELIITHPHEDHIYDLPNLNEVLRPKLLCRPIEAFDITPQNNTDIHKKIVDTANNMNRDYNNPVAKNDDVTLSQNNGGVEFEIIWPKSEWTTKDDLNTYSCLIIIKYCGYKFIVTGDNPGAILKEMMDIDYENIREKIKDSTVLLAPHHGRENEYCKEFFECANPYLTIVSDKSIVHTTQEKTSLLYKGQGANLWGKMHYVLTTRNNGTISLDVYNNNCLVSVEKGV